MKGNLSTKTLLGPKVLSVKCDKPFTSIQFSEWPQYNTAFTIFSIMSSFCLYVKMSVFNNLK